MRFIVAIDIGYQGSNRELWRSIDVESTTFINNYKNLGLLNECVSNSYTFATEFN